MLWNNLLICMDRKNDKQFFGIYNVFILVEIEPFYRIDLKPQ